MLKNRSNSYEDAILAPSGTVSEVSIARTFFDNAGKFTDGYRLTLDVHHCGHGYVSFNRI